MKLKNVTNPAIIGIAVWMTLVMFGSVVCGQSLRLSASAERVWTSADGKRRVSGRMTGLSQTQIALTTKMGPLRIPISALSKSDQAMISRLLAHPKRALIESFLRGRAGLFVRFSASTPVISEFEIASTQLPSNIERLAEFPSLEAIRVRVGGNIAPLLRVCARLPKLKSLILFKQSGTPVLTLEEAKLLSLAKSLQAMSVRVDDAGLKHFAQLKNLRHLRIDTSPVSSVGISHIADLPLETLTLKHTRINDRGLYEVGKLKQLKSLDVMYLRISPNGVGALSQCSQLEEIGVPTHIEHAAWNRLKGTKKLRRIVKPGLWRITNQELAELKRFAIQRLDLAGDDFNNVGLRHLADYRALTKLTVQSEYLNDTCLEYLARAPKLVTLELAIPMNGSGLRGLKSCKSLERLQIGVESSFDGDHLGQLSALPRLRQLDFRFRRKAQAILQWSKLKSLRSLHHISVPAEYVTDEFWTAAGQLANLRELRAAGPSTDKQIRQLAGLRELRVLNLRGSQLTEKSAEIIARFAKLEVLVLRDAKIGAGFVKKLSGLQQLRDLDLQGTQLDDDGLLSLAVHPRLQKIQLTGARVSRGAIRRFRATRPFVVVF